MKIKNRKTLGLTALLAACCVYFMLAGIPLLTPDIMTQEGENDAVQTLFPGVTDESEQLLPVFVVPDPGLPRLEIDGISAQSAVIIEASTGQILYGKAETECRSMASTTKIMTSLIAAESLWLNPDQTVTATFEMVNVEGTKMGIMPDDVVRMRDLISGMLLPSGNDAANVVAYGIGGSQEGFAALMNSRAAEIGMKNTHFVTPSGLDADEHYTTAYDMALLGAEAMKNPVINETARTKSASVELPNDGRKIWLSNHNKLLNKYEYCVGLKTGFTKKSGRCLVSAAEKDGVRLIAVTLNAPDDWNDHIKMYEACFEQIEIIERPQEESYAVPLVGSFAATVELEAKYARAIARYKNSAVKIDTVLELPRFLYAPVMRTDKVGKMAVTADGVPVTEFTLTPKTDLYVNFVPRTDTSETHWYDGVLEFFNRIFFKKTEA